VLGQLAGGVAHQIRNPLAAMKNAAYIVARGLSDRPNGQVERALRIIHDEVDRANHIIRELLDYARVRTPASCATKVSSIVEHALAMQEVPERITVSMDESVFQAPPGRVDLDPRWSGGSTTWCKTRWRRRRPRARFRSERERRTTASSSSSATPARGSRPTSAPRIFEPIVTTTTLGLGLGLVTARTLLEGQGGSLVLAETSTRGTTFEVSLPISKE